MHVGIDAYLAHLTVIEILTRAGGAAPAASQAVQRLARRARGAGSTHGLDTRHHPLQSWDGGGNAHVEATAMTRAMLLEGGLVVDGSGAPGVGRPTCCCAGDRIERDRRRPARALADGLAMGDVDVIDCRGLAIAPGFIDVHTHDDAIVLQRAGDAAQAVARHHDGDHRQLRHLARAVRAPTRRQPPLTLLGTDSFRHASVADYRAAVTRRGRRVNVAALIGHTTLRFATHGRPDRAADGDELRAHGRAARRSAWPTARIGLSSGLFYEQAFAAPADEVTALARVVARHGGVYATHLRSEMQAIIEAMHEAGDCASTPACRW